MTNRLSTPRRVELLHRADELACERATTWRLAARDKDGNRIAAFHLVEASSEDEAIVKVCDLLRIRRSDAQAPTKARPSLSSQQWREIYQGVGLL